MKRLADFRKQVIEGWTVQRIAAVLIVIGVVVFVAGVVNKHCACVGWPNIGETLNDTISDFYANVSVDCLSIAFAILVIDRLNEQREKEQSTAELKEQLIRQMGSRDNGTALRAVEELRGLGWLIDGTLRGADLSNANLPEAGLRAANLHQANLISADLHQSDLRDANLIECDLSAASLHQANLIGANLQKAKLVYANFQEADLMNANLQEADLSFANLLEADLRCANLHQANLKNANLQEARLVNADLQEADLSNANFREADLTGAMLSKASLMNVNFQEAKLTNAHLQEADLSNAILRWANLTGANLRTLILTDEQLTGPCALRSATMPDASRYDGRYSLKSDIWLATAIHKLNLNDPEAMASYYGVSLEEYLAGQEWARENLPRLRREAGLDPDTGRPVDPTNGVEPQPTDAPTAPAPRRNGHKASMVTHRVRR